MTSIHRRKTSREEDEDENLLIAPNGRLQSDADGSLTAEGKESRGDLPLRNRVVSSPSSPSSSSASASPPPSPRLPRIKLSLPQSKGYPNSGSSLRPAFSTPARLHLHEGSPSRMRSVSPGLFSPASPSPLSMSFSSQHIPSSTTNARVNYHSHSSLNGVEPPPMSSASTHSRRHSRLHSRNLSIFFPSPGSLPHSTIAEDGAQELEINLPPEDSSLASVPMPSASPTISRPMQRFGEGFTFGARPPPNGNNNHLMSERAPLPRTSRRGHHHKHSLSHNFFSFLEPGSTGLRDRTSQPTPGPPSGPVSQSTDSSSNPFLRPLSESPSPVSSLSDSSTSPFSYLQDDTFPLGAIAASVWQFALGAWLWNTGQGIGSLACTGLGYWIVFDAIGVALSTILPVYLLRPALKGLIRRPYGTHRLETVALFAQVVYLMFSAVYVFKETIEHVLLSAGEGHHHHTGDEDVELLGIDFPILLPLLSLFSLLFNSLQYENHSKLVNVTGNQLPPLSALLNPARFRYSQHALEPSSRLDQILRNPFSLVPIGVCTLILLISVMIPSPSHRTFDLLLAAAEATAMFHLAYPSCKSIGAVLLQTAPARGHSSGRMESFLRAMREIERHPQVLHLPPPHIWQIAPSMGVPQPLVVTLELRVSPELGDVEVLKLTRWAWERCMLALGLTGRDPGGGGVTVGIVRG